MIRRIGQLALGALAITTLLGCAAEAPEAETAPTTVRPTTTPPAAAPSPEELRHARATAIVEALDTRQQLASILMGTTPGTDSNVLAGYAEGNGLGGFVLMGDNVPGDPAALTALTAGLSPDPKFPLLIAIDEEGGQVFRLPWDGYPGADSLRAAAPEDARAAFEGRAELLRAAGVNVNFGIVADLGTDPFGFIYWRTFGDTAEEAVPRVAAAVTGESGIVASTLKHFPGHGASASDSHTSVPVTPIDLAQWEASHAVPFAAGIAAGAEVLMFGHLVYAAVDSAPASLSPVWHSIARDSLGFTGVTVSDDLGMLLDSGLPEYRDLATNVSRAVAAGADLALVIRGVSAETMPALIDAVAMTVDAGGPSAERLRDAAIQVAELRLTLGERASNPAFSAG